MERKINASICNNHVFELSSFGGFSQQILYMRLILSMSQHFMQLILVTFSDHTILNKGSTVTLFHLHVWGTGTEIDMKGTTNHLTLPQIKHWTCGSSMNILNPYSISSCDAKYDLSINNAAIVYNLLFI